MTIILDIYKPNKILHLKEKKKTGNNNDYY